jgi:hypothetical protein
MKGVEDIKYSSSLENISAWEKLHKYIGHNSITSTA